MRHLNDIFIVFLCAFLLVSCDAPGVYKLDDSLPPLIDITTQYPYVTSILVTNKSGDTLEFTEGTDLDSIRMRFEGIKCIRDNGGEEKEILYNVVFQTTDEDFTISVYSSTELLIDGVRYEAMRSGVDLLYFEGLFKET